MKKRTPSERSVYLTRRLMPGAETLRSFAAPVIVPEIITARITSICLSVIIARYTTRRCLFAPAIIADMTGHVHPAHVLLHRQQIEPLTFAADTWEISAKALVL